MKIEIDSALLKFGLKTLLKNRLTLTQLGIFHGYLLYSFAGKKAPSACGDLFWLNYGLFCCPAAALILGAVCAGFILVQPRVCGLTELLLASPLSLRRLIMTNLAVCSIFAAVNLALHLILLRAAYGVAPHGAGFYLWLASAAVFVVSTLLGTILFSLRTKDVGQVKSPLVMLGMIIWAVGFVMDMKAEPPLWLLPTLNAIFMLAAAGLWAFADKLVSKEGAVLA